MLPAGTRPQLPTLPLQCVEALLVGDRLYIQYVVPAFDRLAVYVEVLDV